MSLPALPPTKGSSPRFPKARLLELLTRISGVEVVWTTYKRGLQGLRPGNEMAWLLAGVQSYMAVGVDETRRKFNATTNRNDVIQVGQRQFTLVLRAQSIDAQIEAFDLLERVRFNFRSKRARALMVPVLGLRDFGPIVDLPESTYNVGEVQRAMLEATLDVRMACVLVGDPGDPEEGNWIETASVEPPNIGGNLLP
jgi:hypothetical protein